jgi:hypothetical protein
MRQSLGLANELSMRRGLLKWNHSCGACDLIRTLGQVVSEIVGSSHEKHFIDEGASLLKLETLPNLKRYLDRDMHGPASLIAKSRIKMYDTVTKLDGIGFLCDGFHDLQSNSQLLIIRALHVGANEVRKIGFATSPVSKFWVKKS